VSPPVVLQVDSVDGEPVDAAELDEALRQLSRDLMDASDVDVEQKNEPAPPGTKGIGTLFALAVTLMKTKTATVAATSAIHVLGDFLNRHRHLKIKVKNGDKLIELSGASPKELRDLLPQVAALLAAQQA
jgi:hypothetical protein